MAFVWSIVLCGDELCKCTRSQRIRLGVILNCEDSMVCMCVVDVFYYIIDYAVDGST